MLETNVDATSPAPVDKRGRRVLSAREQQVLRLVAKGLTSKAIARQLVLSPKTVDHHLASVLNKLGVDSRAHAVATAVRDGLL